MPKLKNEVFSANGTYIHSLAWLKDQALPFDIVHKLNRYYEQLEEGAKRYHKDRDCLIRKFANQKNPDRVAHENMEEFVKEVNELNKIEHFYRFRKSSLVADMTVIGPQAERLGKPIMLTVTIQQDLKGIIEFTGVEPDKEEDLEDIPEEFQDKPEKKEEVNDGGDS